MTNGKNADARQTLSPSGILKAAKISWFFFLTPLFDQLEELL
jgi:hypothetical protein